MQVLDDLVGQLVDVTQITAVSALTASGIFTKAPSGFGVGEGALKVNSADVVAVEPRPFGVSLQLADGSRLDVERW